MSVWVDHLILYVTGLLPTALQERGCDTHEEPRFNPPFFSENACSMPGV